MRKGSNSMTRSNTEYTTKDLPAAAALIVLGQSIKRIEREGRVCWFIFDKKATCVDLVNQFWFGECFLNARDYYQALLTLKSRIFSGE